MTFNSAIYLQNVMNLASLRLTTTMEILLRLFFPLSFNSATFCACVFYILLKFWIRGNVFTLEWFCYSCHLLCLSLCILFKWQPDGSEYVWICSLHTIFLHSHSIRSTFTVCAWKWIERRINCSKRNNNHLLWWLFFISYNFVVKSTIW